MANKKLPTRELLPNYLQDARWLDLADAIDHVFANNVDNGARALSFIRNAWIPSEAQEVKISQGKILRFSEYDMFEQEIGSKQTTMLGLPFVRSPQKLYKFISCKNTFQDQSIQHFF